MATQQELNKNVLVIAPHTDDGELGAGGAMQVLVEKGYDVHYIALASPHGVSDDVAIEQCRLACKTLSPKIQVHSYIRNFEARYFEKSTERQLLLQFLCDINRELAPVIVFTTSSTDFHQDHKVVYKETIRAFKRGTTILGYDFPWNQLVNKANYFIPFNGYQMTNKINSLKCYKQEHKRCEQLQAYSIDTLAAAASFKFNGTNGIEEQEYAEAFEFIKGGMIE